MARRVTIQNHEMGRLTLLLVRELEGGRWEEDWEPLRGTPFGDLFSVITEEVRDHALHGLSRPLTDALGIRPEGALLMLPKVSRQCFLRRGCTFYEPRHCVVGAAKRPWCFEPEGVSEQSVRAAATRAIHEWEQGVYIVVVRAEGR